MKKNWLLLSALVLVLSAFLAACNGGDKNETPSEGANSGDEIQDGGTLTYSLDSAPEGKFSNAFYGTATDAEVIGFFDESLFTYDENLQIEPNLAKWETEDNQKYTFTFEKGVKWHNGEELTVHDWVFALETIAHPDYEGPRYTSVQTIEGAPDFHDGKADSISGLNVIDDYTIEITFDAARVNNLENVWSYALPEKAFEGIEVKDMMASDVVRTKPVGLGPFKVTNIVPGESVEYERFDDYFFGKPHIEKVVLKVIDPSLTIGELTNGTLDMTAFHPSIYDQISALDNINIIQYPGLSYYYIGFKLGNWDGSKNVMDEPKYQNKALREAMYYALNREEWNAAFFPHVGKTVNTPVPSNHWIAADASELEPFAYDPEKAKSILEDAGYKDVDGDGFREDPNGDPFVVKFSHYATQNPQFETRAKAIGQYWEEVGLKTEVTLTDAGLYYDQLEKSDKAIEVFFGGWSTGSDPDPSGLWRSDALWNYPRWVNEKSDQLLDDALDVSIVGDDQDVRKDLYVEWQKNFMSELPALPVAELDEIVAVSKRVQNVKYDVSGSNKANEWWIKQD